MAAYLCWRVDGQSSGMWMLGRLAYDLTLQDYEHPELGLDEQLSRSLMRVASSAFSRLQGKQEPQLGAAELQDIAWDHFSYTRAGAVQRPWLSSIGVLTAPSRKGEPQDPAEAEQQLRRMGQAAADGSGREISVRNYRIGQEGQEGEEGEWITFKPKSAPPRADEVKRHSA